MKKITEIFLYIILALFAFSCRTVQKSTSESYSSKDSVYIIEKPVVINVPGNIIQTQTVNIDSLANLLRSGVSPQVINRTLIKEDPETGLKLGMVLDQLGNLTAVCEQQERMIMTLQKEIYEYRLRISDIQSEKTITKVPNWIYVVSLSVLALIILFILARLRII